jgi:amino acid adenylation domain-containing protein
MTEVTADDKVLVSPTQAGIWFTEYAGEAGTVYHMPMAVHLDGPIDITKLVRACSAATSRHAVLSSAFGLYGDDLYMVSGTHPTTELVDLSCESPSALADLVKEQTLKRFDLARGPVCRLTVATLGPQRTVLLIVAHHAVFDGRSKDILLGDIAVAYAEGGDSLKHDSLLSPALGQHDWGESALADARAFWRPRWRQAHEPNLPGRLVVPPSDRTGTTVPVDIDASLYDRIRSAARVLGVTHFEFLLAAWAVVLHSYGNREIVIGVDVGTRTADSRDAVGPFVNELPMPVSCQPDMRFADFVRVLRADLRGMYRLRAVPVGRALGGLPPRPALTHVSLSYRRRGAGPVFAGMSARVEWTMFNYAARNSLHLQVVEGPEQLAANLQVPLAGFRPGAVEEIAGRYAAVLERATSEHWMRLSHAPTSAGGVAATSTTTTSTSSIKNDCLVRMVEAQAGASPDAVAVVDDAEKLTYQQLRERMNRYTTILLSNGIRVGSLAAVALEPSADRLAWLLAILKCGGAYLPLDPSYPTERLVFMLSDSGASLLLTDGAGAERFAGLAPRVERVDVLTDSHGYPPYVGLLDDVASSYPAYVIYTSGSTGKPKGVVVEHRSLASFLLAVREPLAARPDDVWLSATPLSFDISALELYLPLITGGRLVVAGKSTIEDSGRLLKLIRSEGVNRVQATPARWRQLLDEGLDDPAVRGITGGEALSPALAKQLQNRLAKLLNFYGPTEATIWATWWEVPPDTERVLIGAPLANTTAYVLDEQLDPVLDGVSGELFLGGDAVARGYLGRPELTALQFIPDPFSTHGSRLYRTGDRVRRLADGSLEFLGRVDNQVKIRGYRIEPGEVELALVSHPCVDAAVVAAHGDQLVAYLVSQNPPASAELRNYLARMLPSYMVPSLFRTIDRLPLTPNGKVDRAGLPAPMPDECDQAGEHDGRTSPLDGPTGEICAIWSEVLGVPDIGLHDDLFDLGGHSLTITRLQARIRDRLGVYVPLYVFYDDPTVAGLAAAVSSRRGRA